MSHSEGRPIVRRFVVKRLPLAIPSRSPWILRDRSRPAYLGHYASHALALRAVDNVVRRERGMPERLAITPAEIEKRMSA